MSAPPTTHHPNKEFVPRNAGPEASRHKLPKREARGLNRAMTDVVCRHQTILCSPLSLSFCKLCALLPILLTSRRLPLMPSVFSSRATLSEPPLQYSCGIECELQYALSKHAKALQHNVILRCCNSHQQEQMSTRWKSANGKK